MMVDGTSNWWVDRHGVTYPVFTDNNYAIAQHYTPPGAPQIALPAFTILDRQLNIVDFYQEGAPPNRNLINQLLAEPMPDVDWPMPED